MIDVVRPAPHEPVDRAAPGHFDDLVPGHLVQGIPVSGIGRVQGAENSASNMAVEVKVRLVRVMHVSFGSMVVMLSRPDTRSGTLTVTDFNAPTENFQEHCAESPRQGQIGLPDSQSADRQMLQAPICIYKLI